MKKYFLAIGSLLLMSLVLFGCGQSETSGGGEGAGSSSEEKAQTIKIAHWYGLDHRVNVALQEKFKPMVEENSNGSLKVEIYPASQLGGEEQMYQSVQSGSLEMATIGVIMEDRVPKIGLFTLPYLYKDYAHAKSVLSGEVGADIAAQLEEKTGLKHVGYGINGFRVFSSNRPIESMEDFKGFKVRMPNVPQMIAIGDALGATVTPLPISEIFTALEQRVVDGQDNPYETVVADKWYEVQSHMLESRHMFLPNNIVANQEFWNGLSSEQQNIVQEAMDATTEYEWQLAEKGEDEFKQTLRDEGLTIIEPDEAFLAEMTNATSTIYDDFYEANSWGEEMVEKIRSLE